MASCGKHRHLEDLITLLLASGKTFIHRAGDELSHQSLPTSSSPSSLSETPPHSVQPVRGACCISLMEAFMKFRHALRGNLTVLERRNTCTRTFLGASPTGFFH
jgi:hypothetical protein